MPKTVLRGAWAWLGRRSALVLLIVTVSGLAAGGAARLAGAGTAADAAWLTAAGCGLGYSVWSAVGLRGILYGLHAILRLHTAQEDETYLSLGDTADALAR